MSRMPPRRRGGSRASPARHPRTPGQYLLQHMHHEIHRRIVIVQEPNLERRRAHGVAAWSMETGPVRDVIIARRCLSILADPMTDEGCGVIPRQAVLIQNAADGSVQ